MLSNNHVYACADVNVHMHAEFSVLEGMFFHSCIKKIDFYVLTLQWFHLHW